MPESKNGTYHHYTRVIAPFTTREHRSATGGPHIIFLWHAEVPIGCSNGDLPAGISVKGQGGYIVCPPSRRKGRSYTVHRDIDPAEAPLWLIDLILQGRSPTANTPSGTYNWVDLDELADTMQSNNDLSWEEWTSVGLAIYASTDGQGFDLYAFSQKSSKYDPDTTRERWDEITGSPPSRTGINKLRKIARANGWTPRLYVAEPTYPADGIFTTADAARNKTRQAIRDFLNYSVACPKRRHFCLQQLQHERASSPPNA